MITHYRLINQRVSLPLQLRSLKKKISSVREIEFNLSPRDLQAIIVCYFAFGIELESPSFLKLLDRLSSPLLFYIM